MCLFKQGICEGQVVQLHGRRGFRRWRVTRSGYLKPVSIGANVWHGTFVRYQARNGRLPQSSYQGFHVWKSRKAAADYGFSQAHSISNPWKTVAVGYVAMYGQAFDHGNGYRVEECVVLRIQLAKNTPPKLVKKVRNNYPLSEVRLV